MRKPKAVVLLSGGLDSATVLYEAKSRGYDCRALAFDYGQRHRKELNSARAIAKSANCKLQIIKISLPWKGSALLDKNIKVPKGRAARAMSEGIPVTYVPARNTIFLSFALSFAEAIGADAIFIGANAIDFSGYPDCRPLYYRAFQEVIKKGTRAGASGKGIKINAPLIKKTKAEIIRLGIELKVPYRLTWSCYEGADKPCGECDSCILRAKGFDAAGIKDPQYCHS